MDTIHIDVPIAAVAAGTAVNDPGRGLRTSIDAAEEVFGVAVVVFAEVTAAGEEGAGGAVGIGASPGLGGTRGGGWDEDAVCVERGGG
jgi:hypothetical protein